PTGRGQHTGGGNTAQAQKVATVEIFLFLHGVSPLYWLYWNLWEQNELHLLEKLCNFAEPTTGKEMGQAITLRKSRPERRHTYQGGVVSCLESGSRMDRFHDLTIHPPCGSAKHRAARRESYAQWAGSGKLLMSAMGEGDDGEKKSVVLVK
ncbi:MAG: hypothetical protein WAU10_21800, partial [Caldilineaceae bacterium]